MLGNTTKPVLNYKVITLNTKNRKEQNLKINYLSFYHKKLTKKQQGKVKDYRRKIIYKSKNS